MLLRKPNTNWEKEGIIRREFNYAISERVASERVSGYANEKKSKGRALNWFTASFHSFHILTMLTPHLKDLVKDEGGGREIIEEKKLVKLWGKERGGNHNWEWKEMKGIEKIEERELFA